MKKLGDRDAVIVGYLRSPISRSRPKQPERDVFNWIRADELMAIVVKELIKRTGIDPKDVDDCIFGCSNQTGEQWSYGGRAIVWQTEVLPLETPALAVDRQCASAMTAIRIAAMEIWTENADVVIAGGYEHMTHIPMGHNAAPNIKYFQKEKRFDWRIAINMGLTAERLAEISKIPKEEMDKWSLRSHQYAVKAYQEGYFKDEILPIEVTFPDGTKKIIDRDQSVRPDTSLEKIASLPPAFKPGGVITAGNSSPLNAGAAALVIMSRKKAKEYGLEPLAVIREVAWAAVNPEVMGMGPVPASKKLLQKAGMKVEDIDFWEINEAFAVVTLYAIRELNIDPEKVNVKGGAIAIGHPLGMTGARITGTLARILHWEDGRWGVATLCVGGGQGEAILIERES
ncbi:MAG: acetyl-CoA C-acetyltransferase [Candidatus Baldrarchaeia archaeon]